MCSPDCLLAFLALLFPPVAVWIKVGLCTADSLINLALCCLGYIPGLLHSWYIIYTHPDTDYIALTRDDDIESGPAEGRVHYVYITSPPVPPTGGLNYPPANVTAGGNAPRTYGTTGGSGSVQGQQSHSPAPEESTGGEGNSGDTGAIQPPTYAEALRGDHKIQH